MSPEAKSQDLRVRRLADEPAPAAEHRRILVADQERNLRRAVTHLLSGDRQEIEEAGTRDEVIRAIRGNDYDLIVLDPALADRDGAALIAEIRRHRPKARLVLLTAHATVASAVEAMRMGVADLIEKPMVSGHFAARIAQVLASRREPLSSDYEPMIEEARQLIVARMRHAARKPLAHAVSVCPQRPEAFNLFGAAAELDGERHQAQAFYRAALSLDPTYEPASRNLERSTHLPPGGLIHLGEDQTCEVIA